MTLVTSERRGSTAIVTYANPPLGTMIAAGCAQMHAAIKEAGEDPAVKAIVITGGLPGIFIRHYDIGELVGLSEMISGRAPRPEPTDAPGYGDMVDLVAATPKPVICAINGLCMGGGFELTLASDLRIAARDAAAIGLPETRGGIFPGGGGTQRLPRIVGEAKALDIILRGLTFTGEEAAVIGLVHEAVDDALARALEIAAEFERKGAEGVALAKRLTRSAFDRPVAEGLADERRSFGALLREESANAGLKSALPPNELQKL